MVDNCILKTKNISKTFIITKAVKEVSLEINKGEIRGLVGENGSGKSTLVSIIAGILAPDSGEMIKDGKLYKPKNIIDANKSKVGIIVQEIGTIGDLSVASNIFLGKENIFTKFGLLNISRMNRIASELLNKFEINSIKPNAEIRSLSIEDQKLVEMVKSLYFNPNLLIIDETTTALSQLGRDILYRTIKKLKHESKSVVFISHDLKEIIKYSDQITVMKDGEVVDTIRTKETNEETLKNLMVGRKLKNKYYRVDFKSTYKKNKLSLSAKNLTIKNIFSDISFDLHNEEIFGIGGLTNCGMHELGKALFGLIKLSKGEIIVKNKNITNQGEAISNGIGYIPKNRDQEGLMLLSSIKDNIVIASLDKIQNKTYISPNREKELAIIGVKKLDIKMSSINQFCLFLSGGNKQKVVLSKWLIKNSEILILDCPTRGIDVNVKALIYSLIQQLKNEGKSIILISEELQELIGMSDRIMILKNGEVSNIFNRSKNLSEEEIIHYMI